jgi:hypothetical protein
LASISPQQSPPGKAIDRFRRQILSGILNNIAESMPGFALDQIATRFPLAALIVPLQAGAISPDEFTNCFG